MKHTEQLHTLLATTIIPELETFMQKLQAHIDESGMTDDLNQDQQGIRALHEHFLEMLSMIEDDELDEAACEKFYGEISAMRQMGNTAMM